MLNFDALDPGKKSETVYYMTLGGHRHKSAAQFVYQNHEAMLFVASHDGGLTLFAWIVDSAQVVAVRTFFHGTSLRPVPPGGTVRSKDARWIDIREGDQLDEAQRATWVKQAAALPGWVPESLLGLE